MSAITESMPTLSVYTIAYICDLCGERYETDWLKKGKIGNGYNSEFSLREQGYPEGGIIKKWSVDICPSCFFDKFVPWVESQGAKIQETEISY